MRQIRALTLAGFTGAFCLLVAACGDEINTTCTCTLNQSPFNTQQVVTEDDCESYAASHSEQYSSCIEASGSILGPSRPLAQYLAPRPGGLAVWLAPRLSGRGSLLLVAQLEEIGGTRYLW